ncbi:MAG TPA: EscU/YscU/HrcU family type III secretion system export apparatus switch protein [Verrucomicrobiae bacterium]|nr:EscU/YscU/HrcU family type III secretion system export apparatus switch protein [Verrucomicrobiae bacterium]
MPLDQQAQEKTEQATPRRLEEAAKRGQVAHSSEVQTLFVMLAGLLAMLFTGREMWSLLAVSVASGLGRLHDVPLSQNLMPGYALGAVWLFMKCVGPVVLSVMLAGLLAGGMQSRFNTASEALTPTWSRLDPMEGLKRLFSVRSWVLVGVSAVKLGVIIALTYSVVRDILCDPIFYSSVTAERIAEFLAESSFKLVLRVVVVMAFIAFADYAYQHWQTNKDLMMTKDELKEELKHTEANPLMKAKMRRRRISITFNQMLTEVPKADVVVTNPSHLAIALRYDRKTMRAPKIVAKGARYNALRIREVAAQHQVPLVENKPLARLMYRYGRVGAEIPAQLYAAVAEVLAWVYRTNRYRYYVEANQIGGTAGAAR